jgi:hypothetical protein
MTAPLVLVPSEPPDAIGARTVLDNHSGHYCADASSAALSCRGKVGAATVNSIRRSQ